MLVHTIPVDSGQTAANHTIQRMVIVKRTRTV